jgi:hypothetical protein
MSDFVADQAGQCPVCRARIRAAMEDMSVSAVVRRFLEDYASGETELERLQAKERDYFENSWMMCWVSIRG